MSGSDDHFPEGLPVRGTTHSLEGNAHASGGIGQGGIGGVVPSQSSLEGVLREILTCQLRMEQRLINLEELMSSTQDSVGAELGQLQSDVASQTSVVQSAITLLNGIKAQIAAAVANATAAGADPAQLAALNQVAQGISANTQALAAAVAANTPAASGSGATAGTGAAAQQNPAGVGAP